MIRWIYRTAAAWIAAAVLFCVPDCAAVSVSARSAVLLDADTGRVLWQTRAEERALIASTTKIMTGLIIAEDCDLRETVVISAESVGIEGSSLYLKEGETLSVEALLYGMMLRSGNDAAVALAIHHSGSVEAFAAEMNRKALELGMTETHYVNPHGLDAEHHYSTAMDLAKLTAYAMENPVFYRVVSSKTAVFDSRNFVNHNRLLWQYEGAVGVKTGYTRSAGRILVSCAERDGMRLIAVTISAPDDWNDHKRMLDHGFSDWKRCSVAEIGQVFGSVPVIGGVKATVEAVTAVDFAYTLKEGEQVETYSCLPEFVYPPVIAGDEAGTLIVYADKTEIARVPLYWRETVMEEA